MVIRVMMIRMVMISNRLDLQDSKVDDKLSLLLPILWSIWRKKQSMCDNGDIKSCSLYGAPARAEFIMAMIRTTMAVKLLNMIITEQASPYFGPLQPHKMLNKHPKTPTHPDGHQCQRQ